MLPEEQLDFYRKEGKVPNNRHLVQNPRSSMYDTLSVDFHSATEQVRKLQGKEASEYEKSIDDFYMANLDKFTVLDKEFTTNLLDIGGGEVDLVWMDWDDVPAVPLFVPEPETSVAPFLWQEVNTDRIVVPMDFDHPKMLCDFVTKRPFSGKVKVPDYDNLRLTIAEMECVDPGVDWDSFSGQLNRHDYYIHPEKFEGVSESINYFGVQPFRSSVLKNSFAFLEVVSSSNFKYVVYAGCGNMASSLPVARLFPKIKFFLFDTVEPVNRKLSFNMIHIKENFSTQQFEKLNISRNHCLVYSDVMINNMGDNATSDEWEEAKGRNMDLQLSWYQEIMPRFFRFKVKPQLEKPLLLPSGGKFSSLVYSKQFSDESMYLVNGCKTSFVEVPYLSYKLALIDFHNNRMNYFVSDKPKNGYDDIKVYRICERVAKRIKKSLKEVGDQYCFSNVPFGTIAVEKMISLFPQVTENLDMYTVEKMDMQITSGRIGYSPEKSLKKISDELGYGVAVFCFWSNSFEPTPGQSHLVFFRYPTVVTYVSKTGHKTGKYFARAGTIMRSTSVYCKYIFSEGADVKIY